MYLNDEGEGGLDEDHKPLVPLEPDECERIAEILLGTDTDLDVAISEMGIDPDTIRDAEQSLQRHARVTGCMDCGVWIKARKSHVCVDREAAPVPPELSGGDTSRIQDGNADSDPIWGQYDEQGYKLRQPVWVMPNGDRNKQPMQQDK